LEGWKSDDDDQLFAMFVEMPRLSFLVMMFVMILVVVA
jgi:hypothetical protein